ncbi:hypothetical protein CVT25_008783 [Psilocybe cyanescens]|uniref:Uncharacterized protein n=1 Tax=Psilocybe cyanescens TaxID=93625 RepID=A0A409XN31_PSICY|nr:hypothetical protein CVT25_008783 [Psilocybe cyanescens]
MSSRYVDFVASLRSRPQPFVDGCILPSLTAIAGWWVDSIPSTSTITIVGCPISNRYSRPRPFVNNSILPSVRPQPVGCTLAVSSSPITPPSCTLLSLSSFRTLLLHLPFLPPFLSSIALSLVLLLTFLLILFPANTTPTKATFVPLYCKLHERSSNRHAVRLTGSFPVSPSLSSPRLGPAVPIAACSLLPQSNSSKWILIPTSRFNMDLAGLFGRSITRFM